VQAFSLDRESGIPVKLQFKAHVKYQIATGLLYPGDQLPPLRDLAAGLSINLNTVIRAVDELIEEGYLYSHQGKGVFVADEPPGPVPGAALRSLLAGVLGPAREWGMTPEDAALALLAHAHLARSPQQGSQRLLLIGTARADLRLLQRELEATLPHVAVVTALPEEAGRTAGYKVVVTTLFHGLNRPGVITNGSPAEQESLARLAALPAGRVVAIAAGDWVQAARIRQSLEAAGLGHLRFTLAVHPADLPADTAFLLAAQSGRKLAEEARAARPDLPVLVEPVRVASEALAAIRQGLGSPNPAHRVQIRSSWV
jgi:DNA-binding transcriptional regulator YhcF (GntR family)